MNDTILWYTTRASGLVSLVLLSGVVILGLLARMRVRGRGWPRFLVAGLHRELGLLSLLFLGLHIVTAVVDPYTHLGLVAATVPFGSYYRTFWLGLGTIAVELMVAVVATSLLRAVIGARVWRAVHRLAYLCWPIAVLHGLGTGTDTMTPWSLAITGVCVAAVLVAAIWRLDAGPADPLARERRRHGSAAIPPHGFRTRPPRIRGGPGMTPRLLAGPPAAAGMEDIASHLSRLGPLPAGGAHLVDALERSGLRGRGGTGRRRIHPPHPRTIPTAAGTRGARHPAPPRRAVALPPAGPPRLRVRRADLGGGPHLRRGRPSFGEVAVAPFGRSRVRFTRRRAPPFPAGDGAGEAASVDLGFRGSDRGVGR